MADMLSNKKLNTIVAELFILLHNTISLFQKYETNLYVLFYYENSEQTRTSTNSI